ncbi:translation elongation factor 4 [Patescibacteria group bacterium]|nr:translation elongation factor 4 [Patescibacteria group bacterium]
MNVRNFAIIAHIDAGKSTLADRFLELTDTVEERKMQEQYLDRMELERERGITIQMQPVRMLWHPEGSERSEGQEVILNLVDTPGHVDFSYEVSRSLAAVEGAVLLVDATKGVQAQTIAHLNIARKLGLTIIPVVNKVDSPLARPQEAARELQDLLAVKEEDIYFISAKEGTNVSELLSAIEEKVPSPKENAGSSLQALVFGSAYDAYKGSVAFVRLFGGEVRAGMRVTLLGTEAAGEVKEVGYFLPHMAAQESLLAGDIGYVATGLKDAESVRAGDTLVEKFETRNPKPEIRPQALPGFQIPKPVVFMSLYPEDAGDFDALKTALGKLHLSDPSFTYEVEAKEALGRGFRCGFLGILHSEILVERVQREFRVSLVVSRPSVEFRVHMRQGKELFCRTPADWPSPALVERVEEQWARLEVLTPPAFLSPVTQLLQKEEGEGSSMEPVGENLLRIISPMPLRSLMEGFYDKLKSCTKGMASMDYEIAEWRQADVVKLEFWIAGRNEETLSAIVPREKAYEEGRRTAEKLKELLPPHQFDVALQAVAEGKVIARETIRARRRDVTAPLYGGDVTRKHKLLERQKKGKKELEAKGQGRIQVPPDVLLRLYRD